MDNFTAQITLAILKGEETFQGIPIPSGQTSGTITQQKSYARMKAEEFLKDYRQVDVTLERTIVYEETRPFLVRNEVQDSELVEHLTENEFIDAKLKDVIDSSENFETSDSWSFLDSETNFGGSL